MAKKTPKNMKNNAKNENCVYWNDDFFPRVNFEHVLKNDSENEFFMQKVCKKHSQKEKC